MNNPFAKFACAALCALALAPGARTLIAQDSTNQEPAQPTTGQTDPIAKYTSQLAANPPDADKATIYFLRGRTYKDKGEFDKAIADFNEAIRINPNYGYAFTLRGGCYFSKNDYEKALADYDQVIRIEPKNYKVMGNRGLVHDAMGEYDKAITAFSESIQVNPQFPLTRVRRAWDYQITGSYDLALADCNEAIRLAPNNGEAYSIRGETYAQMGDADKAMADFDKAISVDPKDARAYFSRGSMHASQGAYVEAVADLQQSAQLNPKSPSALNQLAWLLSVCPRADVRDGKKAVEYAQHACELSQWKNPAYIDTLAAAYAESGDFDNAIKYEQQFVKWPGLGQPDIERANGILTLYQAHKPYREGQ